MIQHPVYDLNPPRQILIPKGPQEKMFPIKVRILIKRSFEILERTTSNSTIRLHAIPPHHDSFHWLNYLFVDMRSISHGIFHTIITRTPILFQKLGFVDSP